MHFVVARCSADFVVSAPGILLQSGATGVIVLEGRRGSPPVDGKIYIPLLHRFSRLLACDRRWGVRCLYLGCCCRLLGLCRLKTKALGRLPG